MLYAFLFLLIFLLTCWVMVVFLKPTRSERILRDRLTKVEQIFVANPEEATLVLRDEKLSDVPWLDQLLRRIPGIRKLQNFVLQSGSEGTVGRLFASSALLLLLCTWLASFRAPSLVLALLIGLVAACVPFLRLGWQRAARFNRFDAILSDAIDLMSRALRAGHGVVSTIEMVSLEIPNPVASEFRRVFEQQSFGLPLREAMLGLADRVPLPDVRILVTAILVQKETGGNLAEVLDKCAFVIRERHRLRGQVRVHTAQGRLTAWILGLLPFGLFLLMNVLNPSYGRILIEDPLGRKLIYGGLALMVIGILMIRRIVDVKV